MDHTTQYKLQYLSTSVVECDKNQPRHNIDSKSAAMRSLMRSVERMGIRQPIVVTKVDKRFIIIDGNRRFMCAKALKFKTVPCLVCTEIPKGQLEAYRFDMQTVRQSWKPVERADAYYRIKHDLRLSNKELAEYLCLPLTSVRESLAVRDQQVHFMMRLQKHQLNQSFITELIQLKKYVRKMANMEPEEIINEIISRISVDKSEIDKITSSKEIRILKKAFIRATPNEAALTKYLKNPDMTTRELNEQITRSGFSADIQRVIDNVAKKQTKGTKFTKQELEALQQLKKLMKEVL